MPLYADGLKKIQKSLELVASGQWSPYEKVGRFTPEQLEAFNAIRTKDNLKPIGSVIVCNGKHLYESRCTKDGYSIDQIVEQVRLAFELATHISKTGWAITLRSLVERTDEQGNLVRDEIVFQCNEKHSSASLFSVIPRGDGRGPRSKR